MTPQGTTGATVAAADIASVKQFAADVQYYLAQNPRQLPSRYLYDPLGSSLFEAICELPWYGVTRAEERLLVEHAREVFRQAAPVTTIVELGSGSGEKLRTLIEEGGVRSPLDVHLVDLSSRALETASRTLAPLGQASVVTHQRRYEEGLSEATANARTGGRMLVLFLGSNIGNFDPPGAHAFLRTLHSEVRSGDYVLLGTDLVKPERDLLLAYDDPLGVTAAFNLNLLVRMNRDLGADFDIDAFAHRAIWNEAQSRVEMHLVSLCGQRIHVPAADMEFSMEKDEIIWTESSYKYRPHDAISLLARAGFRVETQWINDHYRFALTLAEAT